MNVKLILKQILAIGIPDNSLSRLLYRLLYRFCVLCFETGQWLKKLFLVEPTVRAICFRVGKRLRIERVPYCRGRGRITIGDDVYISGQINIAFNANLGFSPTLQIGHHSFIGHACSFSLAKEIRIGDYCLIASSVRFFDNDGHPFDALARRKNQKVAPQSVAPIMIGDDVWIGHGCLILKGVTIGARAVVGACSVVTRSIPADAIAVGNPAKVIRILPPSSPLTSPP